jgi:hypothetical protein
VQNTAIVHIEPWGGRVLGIDDSLPQKIVHQWVADIHDGSAGGPVGSSSRSSSAWCPPVSC